MTIPTRTTPASPQPMTMKTRLSARMKLSRLARHPCVGVSGEAGVWEARLLAHPLVSVESIEAHLIRLAKRVVDRSWVHVSLVLFHVEEKAAGLADHGIRSPEVL